MKPKIDVIWNVTRLCMWDCDVCCVDATHIKANAKEICLKSNSLQDSTIITRDRNVGDIYAQAEKYLQDSGQELSFKEKLTVLDNLQDFEPKIDFSGGDPFISKDTIKLIHEASNRFGRNNVTVTATGAGLIRVDPIEVAPFIGELNFTYDSPSKDGNRLRPDGYSFSNLKRASEYSELGVKTRGETPLTKENVNLETLEQIYLDLHRFGIQTHLIMRLFPVGRGEHQSQDIPSNEEYKAAISLLRKLEQKYVYPKVKLQCALKHLDNQNLSKNPCDAVVESFGLMWDGTLLASPWAINSNGKPLNEDWTLGNLAQESMKRIMTQDKVKAFIKNGNNNFGHCKILAYLNHEQPRSQAAIFSKKDPLYEEINMIELV